MSILVDKDIEKLTGDIKLIRPFDRSLLQGASYDMRIGGKYIRGGVSRELISPEISIKLEPGEFVVLSTYEYLALPQNLVGHNGLMSDWAKQGLVCLFGAQIDPGFHGHLFVPVFNAGDGPVLIQLHTPFFTVEFTNTTQPAEADWAKLHGTKRSAGVTAQTPISARPSLADVVKLQQSAGDNQRRLLEMEGKITNYDVRLRAIEGQINYRLQQRTFTIAIVALMVSIIAAEPILTQIKKLFAGDSKAVATELAPKQASSAASSALK